MTSQHKNGGYSVLTRQMRTVLRPYQNLGLVSPGWIISHHTN